MYYTTQKQIRTAFWDELEGEPGILRKRIKYADGLDYLTDTRIAFVDFVDHLHRDGMIGDALAQRVTL